MQQNELQFKTSLHSERDEARRQLAELQQLNREAANEIGDYLVWKTRAIDLEAQLAALQWQPITSTSLPKVGDEVFGEGRLLLITRDWLAVFQDAKAWVQYGLTHRRPLLAPAPSTAHDTEEL